MRAAGARGLYRSCQLSTLLSHQGARVASFPASAFRACARRRAGAEHVITSRGDSHASLHPRAACCQWCSAKPAERRPSARRAAPPTRRSYAARPRVTLFNGFKDVLLTERRAGPESGAWALATPGARSRAALGCGCSSVR